MKPEDLVPTRETCIALKEAGFPQDTFLWWSYAGHGTVFLKSPPLVVQRDRTSKTHLIAAAPTLGEILEQLPQKSVGLVKQTWPIEGTPDYQVWAWEDQAWADNPAEAAARLWIRVNGKETK